MSAEPLAAEMVPKRHTELRLNLNAATTFTLAMLAYGSFQLNTAHFAVAGIGALWAAWMWRKWFVTRHERAIVAIRSLREIWSIERERMSDSFFLLSPLIAGCFVGLGYLQAGRKGLLEGACVGFAFIFSVWLAERYPAEC